MFGKHKQTTEPSRLPTGSARGATEAAQVSPLGARLLADGLVTEQALRDARARQLGAKRSLVEVLVEQDAIQAPDLVWYLIENSSLEPLSTSRTPIDPEARDTIPSEYARANGLLPVRVEGDVLHVATCDPFQLPVFDEIATRTGLRVRPWLVSTAALDALWSDARPEDDALDDLLRNHAPDDDRIAFVDEDFVLAAESGSKGHAIDVVDSESAVVRFVNFVIADGIRQQASDIHIEAEEEALRVRFRIDGDLQLIQTLSPRVHHAVISRLKIVSGLDIIETRRPQDGRASVSIRDRTYDLRVSTMPSYFGEKAVIRVLDPDAAVVDLESTGLEPDVLAAWRGLLQRPHGLVLMTGPTGSGKTSTLYGSVLEIRSPTRNIVTVEDPVEFQFPGLVQVPVREDIGMTFARALRSILRQDPDVVLLGEIRDTETAEVAVQAALTGHLVLSTLHTNDAVSAVSRLVNLGVERELLGSALLGVMAQRLVRTVCTACAEPHAWLDEDLAPLGGSASTGEEGEPLRGQGCARCRGTGLKGRTALTELLTVDAEMARLITQGASEAEILACAKRSGMRSLTESGRRKVLLGVTTPQEALRVAGPCAPAARATPPTPQPATSVAEAAPPGCAACGTPVEGTWLHCPACGQRVERDGTGATVLVCDDQALIRRMASAALAVAGLRVVEAEDGRSCLDVIARERPDLLLVDQMMPGLTGVEVIRELRSTMATVDLPIIMLTAVDDADLETAVLDAGADDYLTKPVKPERLATRVRALLAARERRDAAAQRTLAG